MRMWSGTHVEILEWSPFFRDVTLFLLEHFDQEQYKDHLLVLGAYIFKTMHDLRREHPGKKIVVVQLEQLIHSGWAATASFVGYLAESDEIWEYDDSNSAFLTERNIPHRRLHLGYAKSLDVGLATPPAAGCDIDVLFYGVLNARRHRFLESFLNSNYASGLTFVFAYGVAEGLLDDYIRRSKIVLSIHAFEDGLEEQTRLLRLLANGKAVVAEWSPQTYFPGCTIQFISSAFLNGVVQQLLARQTYVEVGRDAREKFMQLTTHRKMLE